MLHSQPTDNWQLATATVTWDADGILGIGLEVTVTSGTLDAVEVNGFNVFIDEVSDAVKAGTELTALPTPVNPVANASDAGAVEDLTGTFAICAGYLAENNPGVLAADGSIVFTASETTTLSLDVNAKRGGVVDADGVVATNLPIPVTVTVVTGPTCSDYNFTAYAGGSDTLVDVSDVTAMVSYIDANKAGFLWRVMSTDAGFDATYDLNDDSKVDVNDVTELVSFIDENKTSFLWRVSCN